MIEYAGLDLRVIIDTMDTSSQRWVFDWVLQILNKIEVLHDIGFVHGDLKLQNLCIKDGVIKLIDFGISTNIYEENGKHIREYCTKNFRGNLRFASLATYHQNIKSRRDDFESLLYILMFLLNN